MGADIANIGALSFPKVVDICLHRDLENCITYDEFVDCIKNEIKTQCDAICENIKNIYFVPSPFMNVCMKGGIYNGGKYNNFGIHGSGVATATDSLFAIKEHVYG